MTTEYLLLYVYVLCPTMCVLTWVLLFVWLGGGVCVCMMENYTLLIEKRGCTQCIAVNTTICSGFCHTQDTNVKGRVGKSYLIQRGCMPHSLVYHPARVPGCPLHVSNVLYYPESRRCHCTRCDGHAHRCVHMTQATPTPCTRKSPDPHRTGRTHPPVKKRSDQET